MIRKIFAMAVTVSITLLAGRAHGQGVHMWYDDQLWRQNIDQSITTFFGDHVGTYVGYGLTEKKYTAQKAARIGNQFLVTFDGVPLENTALSGNNQLFAFAKPHDANVKAAVVTAVHGTEILAAGLIHYSCGTISRAHIFDSAAVTKNYSNACSSKPTLTIFFNSMASRNPQVRDDLLAWGKRNMNNFKFEVRILN